MAVTEPTAEKSLDGYGAPLIPWMRVRENRHTYWLGRRSGGRRLLLQHRRNHSQG